jgi:demethylmenaquinone methyltransferase/2-methoxy-6-polyprenyl-1,4-benzoquinol methylase
MEADQNVMWAQKYYNAISRLYDHLTREVYATPREIAIQALRLPRGATVLDLACGTGLNFPLLVQALGPEGHIIGVDHSGGMLRQARVHVERNGWSNVTLIHEDARNVSTDLLQNQAGIRELEGFICTLGLSVVPDWEQVFARAFSLVKSGGRCVLMDSRTWDGPGRILNPVLFPVVKLSAAADIRRPTWRLLEGRVDDLRVSYSRSRHCLPRCVFVASGTKP